MAVMYMDVDLKITSTILDSWVKSELTWQPVCYWYYWTYRNAKKTICGPKHLSSLFIWLASNTNPLLRPL